MALIKRRDPFTDVVSLSTGLGRFFDDFFPGRYWEDENFLTSTWVPSVDVYEKDDALEITAELPGVNEQDVEVHVEGGVLTIRGEKKHEEETKKENYYRLERSYGSFQRSFTLPTSVKSDSIEATFTNGVLKLHIPKTEKAKPKTIPIKTD